MRSKHSGTNIVLTFQSVRWYPQVMAQHNGNRYNVCAVPFVDLIGPTWPPLPFLACRSMYESVIRHQSLYTFQLLPAHVVAQSMDLIYFICIYNNDIIKLIYMYNRNYYYNKMIWQLTHTNIKLLLNRQIDYVTVQKESPKKRFHFEQWFRSAHV